MRRLKKLCAMAFAVLLAVSAATAAMAAGSVYELEGDTLRFQVPEGAYVFTPATSSSDPQWAEAGIDDPVEYISNYSDLGVVAQISMNGNADNIFVSKKNSSTTEYYYNLAEASKEDMDAFIAQFNSSSETGTTVSTGELYEGAKFPFLRIHIVSEQIGEEKTFYELHYLTVVNGSSYSFNTHAETEITAEQEAMIRSMVDTADFGTVTPKPKTTADPKTIMMMVVVLIILAILIGMLVYSRMKRTSERKHAKALAVRLSEYRRNQKDDLGPCLFENTTDHNGEAIREFTKYQTYHRHLFNACFSIIITAGGAVASFYLGSAWWLTLIFALAALYCVYKLSTAAGVMEKALKRSFAKLRTTKAHYAFFENEFTIAGTQSHETYPYFQITDIAEYKNYFYIYFGENVTNYVCKSGFTVGKPEDFKQFITGKIKENKKQGK